MEISATGDPFKHRRILMVNVYKMVECYQRVFFAQKLSDYVCS